MVGNKYTIRQILQFEISWLRSTDFNKLFAQLTNTTELNESQFKDWWNEIFNNPSTHLYGIIENNNTLVGVGMLILIKKYYRQSKNSGLIEDIVIDKAHRGQGLGKKLIEYIKKQANAYGCYKVHIQCSPNMKEFYKKLDFNKEQCSMQHYFADTIATTDEITTPLHNNISLTTKKNALKKEHHEYT